MGASLACLTVAARCGVEEGLVAAEAAVRAGLRTVVPVKGQNPATLLLRLAQTDRQSPEEK
jgi:hypothetical protein